MRPVRWRRFLCELRGHAWRRVPLPEFLYPTQHFKCIHVSHPECGSKLIEWPEMLLPGDLRCRRCDRDIDPNDEVCDASVASGRPHHMQCPVGEQP